VTGTMALWAAFCSAAFVVSASRENVFIIFCSY
jgi:hypothetical protein